MKKLSIEHYTGCLLGGAIGDALGAPVEFMDINQIRSRYGSPGIRDFVEFPGNEGEFTDDTQMTLFTAEALLRAAHRASMKGIGGALNTIAHHSYLSWLHTQGIALDAGENEPGANDLINGWLLKQKALHQRRAPGNTCINALSNGRAGTIRNPINDSKGCGTIMRIAPVGLMFTGEAEKSFETGCELSAITHGHPTGYLSGGCLAALVSDLASGTNLDDGIRNMTEILQKWDHHDETLHAIEQALELYGKIKNRNLNPSAEDIERLGSGWIAEEALSMSIFTVLLFRDDFSEGILFAVNHSGDIDSTGSITGNILGLINGVGAIPEKWIRNLKFNYIVRQVAEDLHIRVKGDYFNPDDDWWERYPGY